MIIVEATAATRIRAMKTIIAPIPMDPSVSLVSLGIVSRLIQVTSLPDTTDSI
jgi:hypothetical protein